VTNRSAHEPRSLYARLVLLASTSAAAALLSVASPARADVQLGVDLDSAIPLESPADPGGGFAARLGYQLHLPMLALTPEAVFNYEGFTGTYGLGMYRGVAGLRLGAGEVFRLGAFGHLGIGHLSADVPGPDPTRTGVTYDLGIFFDFTLLPLINLGVHTSYDRMPNGDGPAFHWLVFGAHLELIV
jgi:hypothetical protein